jgi:hypothetical protein
MLMKNRNVWSRLFVAGTLAIAMGSFSLEANASTEITPPVGQLKLSQMTIESTQCPFSTVAKAGIDEENQPAIRKKSPGAISIAAE